MNKINNIFSSSKKFSSPPIWIMRQAGRYLPEYREIRSQIGSFLDLCYNPKMAAEVTLQPLRRFDLDAAIIFSDILVIPHALGVKVDFVKNEGPVLGKISALNELKISDIEKKLQPVFEALALTKSKLGKDKALIGFSGSPWTLACYMIEGGSSKNFEETRKTALQNEEYFSQLIDILIEAISIYLIAQIRAGADVVKLFDSWAGILPENDFQKWVINPTKKIIANVKKIHPNVPIICFPRGCGMLYENFAREVKSDALALDQNVKKSWASDVLQNQMGLVIQGNLDNHLLAFGSKFEIEKEVKKILEIFGKKPFIFNLGHGILPQTPIENMEFLVKLVRQ